ncbi:MAG: sodium:proton antiporter [Candidatus Cloacimonas sp. SDB]|nr:MAG: sodium:proton antiporter [Candidatus Cloacimonas sp. SDB]
MAKRFITLLLIALLAYMFLPFIVEVDETSQLNRVAEKYVTAGPLELGAANLVTAVIVTYRGLDTLGEIVVLFIAAVGIGFLLRKPSKKKIAAPKRSSSEILRTGSDFLIPLLILFGVYIFTHGHLTPGGGFQGGVVLTSAALLFMLSNTEARFNKQLTEVIESVSGIFYLIIGILGLILAGGFLDSRFLQLGEMGRLFSAGAIPIIYSIIGIKVGMELIGILEKLRKEEI